MHSWQISRDEESLQISYVPMLQPILGYFYWYFIWNLPKLKTSMRDPAASTICALPVQDCNLVFRLDRRSSQLRVQFQIRKGSYERVVNALQHGESEIRSMREQWLGKWIKDDISDVETWLLIVAVKMLSQLTSSTIQRNKKSLERR